jgi:hypothetical protein
MAPLRWWSRPLDGKVERLARTEPFVGLARWRLERFAQLADELVIPPGTVLARPNLPVAECLLIAEPGGVLVTEEGANVIPPGGGTLGLAPWLERRPHDALVLAGSDLPAYVIGAPVVLAALEVVPAWEWTALDPPRFPTAAPTG